MRVAKKSVGGAIEILAADDFVGIPIKVTEEATVKAGMPMKKDGKKDETGAAAFGILLYDVDPSANPNGTVVVQGVVNTKAAKESCGVDLQGIAAALKEAVPGVVLRDNVGVTTA